MIFPLIVKCQCFVSSVDTFSCSTGDLLILDADVSGAFDTENYTISNIPFMPVSEGSLKSFPLLIEDDQTLGPFPIGFNFNFSQFLFPFLFSIFLNSFKIPMR